MDKLVIAPQIVVYKNAFKHSKEIIELLSKNNEDSLFTPWRDWYGQGYRRDHDFDRSNVIKSDDSEIVKLEKTYLQDVCAIVDDICHDYFLSFEKENGIWPSFISDWDELKKQKQSHYIDFFRYDHKLIESKNIDSIFMPYHVDEFPIANEAKVNRSVLTINFYLNNDYLGGEICAYDATSNKSYKYKPNPGDIVVMPSTEPFYHAVKNMYGADRYFLRTFITFRTDGSKEWQEKYLIEGDTLIKKVEFDKDEYVKNNLQTTVVHVKEERVEG